MKAVLKRLRAVVDTKQASFVLVPRSDLLKLLQAYDKLAEAMQSGSPIRAVTVTPESPAEIARRLQTSEKKIK